MKVLKCICDLCGAEIGDLGSASVVDGSYQKKQVRVTVGGTNIYIGDLCITCQNRLRDLLNLPKAE